MLGIPRITRVFIVAFDSIDSVYIVKSWVVVRVCDIDNGTGELFSLSRFSVAVLLASCLVLLSIEQTTEMQVNMGLFRNECYFLSI